MIAIKKMDCKEESTRICSAIILKIPNFMTDKVNDVLITYDGFFSTTIHQLGGSISVLDYERICDSTFSTGTSWGRIIAVLALATHVDKKHVISISNVFADRVSDWILANGGWTRQKSWWTRIKSVFSG